jgi:hypothetical protein
VIDNPHRNEVAPLVDMIHNPYWEEVAPLVSIDRTWHSNAVVKFPALNWLNRRQELTSLYAWTITDPATFDFVRAHCPNRVLDPLAGTGYWAYLLGQVGVEVIASDRHPPHPEADLNIWHPLAEQHVPVTEADAVQAMGISEPGDTLLLGWPPATNVAEATVKAFRGNQMVYIGESGDSCASPSFWAQLALNWHPIGAHTPVQFEAMRDHVTVWSRNNPIRAS